METKTQVDQSYCRIELRLGEYRYILLMNSLNNESTEIVLSPRWDADDAGTASTLSSCRLEEEESYSDFHTEHYTLKRKNTARPRDRPYEDELGDMQSESENTLVF